MKRLPLAAAEFVDRAAEHRARLDGRPVVLSISGGKDSTAMALLLIEAAIPFQAVHMDTGWEHEDTEGYVRDYLPGVVGPVRVIQSHLGGMERLVLRRGMFPTRKRRFCTQELKVRPMQRHIRGMQRAGEDPVNAVGIRGGESARRATFTKWEDSEAFDCEVWRPILALSEDDVIAVHRRHGVAPNPLYLRGARRVGCWPCIYARKDEIRMVAETDPGRIDRIRDIERRVNAVAEEKFGHAAAGRPPVAFFTNLYDRKSGHCTPIDRAVEWSRTTRGGKQFDLFTPPYADEGCMRWGLCETSPD